MKSMLALIAQHKQGVPVGIYAVCSAHPLVLEAALRLAAQGEDLLLVEATSNQVDQFGGYTGMTPVDFRDRLHRLAAECNFPLQRLVLGGDHLGPNRWQGEPAEQAMEHAEVLIASYVAAGFKKIHLDCSMSCLGDPVPLPDELVAERAARLALIAEQTCLAEFGCCDLVYVIGTEVPVPGGAHETLAELAVTTPEAARHTLSTHQQAFARVGLEAIWPRVIGLVVQPGVEFDHTHVIDYQSDKAAPLSRMIEAYPHLVFEAHSTDYQTPQAYCQLVRDHFAILKVGPAATFAYREALFALAAIETELLPAAQCSRLPQVLEQVMLAKPKNWQAHYHGDDATLRLLRAYAFSDRCRYYWGEPELLQAVQTLFANLQQHTPPLVLLSQYLPGQYVAVREGQLAATPAALVQHRIGQCLGEYARACSANQAGTRKQSESLHAANLAKG